MTLLLGWHMKVVYESDRSWLHLEDSVDSAGLCNVASGHRYKHKGSHHLSWPPSRSLDWLDGQSTPFPQTPSQSRSRWVPRLRWLKMKETKQKVNQLHVYHNLSMLRHKKHLALNLKSNVCRIGGIHLQVNFPIQGIILVCWCKKHLQNTVSQPKGSGFPNVQNLTHKHPWPISPYSKL